MGSPAPFEPGGRGDLVAALREIAAVPAGRFANKDLYAAYVRSVAAGALGRAGEDTHTVPAQEPVLPAASVGGRRSYRGDDDPYG